MDRKKIDFVYDFTSKLSEIGAACQCTIKAHGTETSRGIVWIRIQSKVADSRRKAIKLINEFTKNACKEVRYL